MAAATVTSALGGSGGKLLRHRREATKREKERERERGGNMEMRDMIHIFIFTAALSKT